MKYHMFFIILLFCSLSSCGSFELDTDRATDSRPIHFITKSPTRVGGHFVNNTYEVANMQIACDSLCNLYNLPRIILNPTDVYVRFLPKDSIEYRAILSLGTDFFDLPLTYEPDSVISYYRDPSVPDSLMTWQYTMVPFGVTLPNVEHEIIDTCYIPSESRLAPIAGFNLLLDELANRIANPDEDYFNDNNDHKIAHNRPSVVYPSGRAMVRMNGISVPLRNVKIVVRHITKYASTFTDSSGNYTVSESFSVDPRYEVIFENSNGFAEYDGALSPSPAWIDLDHQFNTGFSFIILPTNSKWQAAAVNNRIVEYLDLCTSENRQLPPNNMRVLLWTGDAQGSGAPMLRQIGSSHIGEYSINTIIEAFLGRFCGSLPAQLYHYLKYALPDLFILYHPDSTTEEYLHESVFHELNHASHFANAGVLAWTGVIVHTVRSSWPVDIGYGTGLINDWAQDVCELAESWAFVNQRKLRKENGYNTHNPDEFFIRRQSNASMVYRQIGNGTVITAMNRPFFVENQWMSLDSTYAIGNNRIIEYTYTLSGSDIQ